MSKFSKFKDIKNEITWFIQRGRRGYSDLDIWEIDTWFATVFASMLRDFSKETKDYPPYLNGSMPPLRVYGHAIPEEDDSEELLAWKKEVAHLANLFEGTRHDCGIAASEEQVRCRDEALELLKKYYFDLWC